LAAASLIPPLVAVVLTLMTKNLVPSLLIALVTGTLLETRSLMGALVLVGDKVASVLASRDSAYTLGFLVLFGSLADIIQMAGGIAGFAATVEKWVTSEKRVLGTAWLMSLITFFDSSFHIIAVGTVLGPLLEKVKASKEKFAFVLTMTSLQLIVLVPVATAYLGYMTGLVGTNMRLRSIAGVPYAVFLRSIPFNFFSLAMLLIAAAVSAFGLRFGTISLGKVKEGEGLTPEHIEKEASSEKPVEEYPKNAWNLIVPVGLLLSSTLTFLWLTGRATSATVLGAFATARFSESIFAGALFALLTTGVFYVKQGISLAEVEAHVVSGGEKVFSLVMILVLSWSLTDLTQQMGFDNLVGASILGFVPRAVTPATVFLVSAAISYTLGSSWATWALMMPVAIAAAQSGLPLPVMVGTVWAGGSVADAASPLAAQTAGISYGRHLVTSLPFVLVGIGLAAASYLILGLAL